MLSSEDSKLLQEIKAFQEQQKSLHAYFTPEALKSREVKQHTLDSYRAMYQQHSGEKGVAMRVLKAEIRGLEKDLYPNWIVRQVQKAALLLSNVLAVNAPAKVVTAPPVKRPVSSLFRVYKGKQPETPQQAVKEKTALKIQGPALQIQRNRRSMKKRQGIR